MIVGHIFTIIALSYYKLVTKSLLLITLLTSAMQTFGITAGYHRYWSHRAFETNLGFKICLAIFGSAAVQGSIKWWVTKHRVHHAFTDTEYDYI